MKYKSVSLRLNSVSQWWNTIQNIVYMRHISVSYLFSKGKKEIIIKAARGPMADMRKTFLVTTIYIY